MLHYFNKLEPNMATMVKPVKPYEGLCMVMGPAQQKAFDSVKKEIASSMALGFYDPRKKAVVNADSSSYGLGATIMQWNGDKLIPMAFASRTLTDAECRYAQIEKKCLASVWACEKFAKYLLGLGRFELQTDHKPLVPLMITKGIDCATVGGQRLLMRLTRFNAEVKHAPGKHIVMLMRFPEVHLTTLQLIRTLTRPCRRTSMLLRHRGSASLDILRAATVHDAELQQVINYVCSGWPHVVPTHLQAYQQAQGELSIVKGLFV